MIRPLPSLLNLADPIRASKKMVDVLKNKEKVDIDYLPFAFRYISGKKEIGR